MIKGGHSDSDQVINSWFRHGVSESQTWQWPRLQGEFHGSGCTLASAIAGLLAHQKTMQESLQLAQMYTHFCLEEAFSIAAGQAIPQRIIKSNKGQ